MNLNVLLRGQSNAQFLAEAHGWAGAGTIIPRVQQLLGFDGVCDTVSLEYAAGATSNTVNSGTAFIGTGLPAAPATGRLLRWSRDC